MTFSEFTSELLFAVTNLPPFFPLTTSGLLFYFTNGVLFLIVFKSLYMVIHLLLNKQLSFFSKRYASSDSQDKKILILGDSTAYGTGASRAEDTIAGRLAHDFPHSQIINYGKNGGLIKDLKSQVKKARGQVYDMIIVSAGGNDVWHLSGSRSMRKNLIEICEELVILNGGNRKILFLLYNNIGSAPIFPRIIQFFLVRRCKRVQDLIRDIVTHYGIIPIELFNTDGDNPFLKSPETLFARDGVHPSSRGYELWYHRMWREMAKHGVQY